MIDCRNLELHLAHGCNLACESCSHYSNHQHTGLLSVAEARDWMRHWSGRLRPAQFSLLGGEPCLNPALARHVWLTGEMFPQSKLILVTNGFLLNRHPRLPVALRGTGAVLHISVHHGSAEYRDRLEPIRRLVADWQQRWNIPVQWRPSSATWTRRYQGFGREMKPYDDNDPAGSWQNCVARWCLQLHEGRLWKCPAVAYLEMQDRKYSLSDDWKPYLHYTPLEPSCTDAELHEFVNRRVEPVCAMCPAKPDLLTLPLPFRTKSQTSATAQT
jgi:hypothetical protein